MQNEYNRSRKNTPQAPLQFVCNLTIIRDPTLYSEEIANYCRATAIFYAVPEGCFCPEYEPPALA